MPMGAGACNPPVDDPVAQLRALRDHGDVLGFRMGNAPAVSMSDHWQGVQRMMPRMGQYLVVSRFGANVSFVVVRMASRNVKGARYRSNRIATRAAFQPPPPRDVVAHAEDRIPAMTTRGAFKRSGRSSSSGWRRRALARTWRSGSCQHRPGQFGSGR
jgi:hypothetical protein